MAEERASPGLIQRIAALPLWARLAGLTVLIAIGFLFRNQLVLLFLIALGLWPITLLLGLAVLALISTQRGGWPWMKQWLGTRLRGLLIPALSAPDITQIAELITNNTFAAIDARRQQDNPHDQ